MFGVHHHRRRPLLQRSSLTPKKVWGRVASLILSSYLYVVMKEIINKLKEIEALLDEHFEAINMDVEHMQQRVQDMIDEFEEVGEFEYED